MKVTLNAFKVFRLHTKDNKIYLRFLHDTIAFLLSVTPGIPPVLKNNHTIDRLFLYNTTKRSKSMPV